MTPKMLFFLMLFMHATAFKYMSEIIHGLTDEKIKLSKRELFYRVWIITIVLMFAFNYVRTFSHLG